LSLTLEHLESAFYEEGLRRFSNRDFENAGFSSGVRDQLIIVGSHESTHVTALSGLVAARFGKDHVVPPCEYNFGLSNVQTFVAIAAALEKTGVSAYDGAIKFVDEDTIKTDAATIATVEGRHSSLLNVLNVDNRGRAVNAIPGAFDTPLGFRPVLSIAAPFIRSCPFPLPVQPFPALTLGSGSGRIGDDVSLTFS
ncbi:ferritin-like domain-containing protein, partial [Blyttiomyces helicus]